VLPSPLAYCLTSVSEALPRLVAFGSDSLWEAAYRPVIAMLILRYSLWVGLAPNRGSPGVPNCQSSHSGGVHVERNCPSEQLRTTIPNDTLTQDWRREQPPLRRCLACGGFGFNEP